MYFIYDIEDAKKEIKQSQLINVNIPDELYDAIEEWKVVAQTKIVSVVVEEPKKQSVIGKWINQNIISKIKPQQEQQATTTTIEIPAYEVSVKFKGKKAVKFVGEIVLDNIEIIEDEDETTPVVIHQKDGAYYYLNSSTLKGPYTYATGFFNGVSICKDTSKAYYIKPDFTMSDGYNDCLPFVGDRGIVRVGNGPSAVFYDIDRQFNKLDNANFHPVHKFKTYKNAYGNNNFQIVKPEDGGRYYYRTANSASYMECYSVEILDGKYEGVLEVKRTVDSKPEYVDVNGESYTEKDSIAELYKFLKGKIDYSNLTDKFLLDNTFYQKVLSYLAAVARGDVQGIEANDSKNLIELTRKFDQLKKRRQAAFEHQKKELGTQATLKSNRKNAENEIDDLLSKYLKEISSLN